MELQLDIVLLNAILIILLIIAYGFVQYVIGLAITAVLVILQLIAQAVFHLLFSNRK